MTSVQERLYIDAPYVQTADALVRRLGIAKGAARGECTLSLVLPVAGGRDIARTVKARTERVGTDADYLSRYSVAWDAGLTARGIPTPAFSGTLIVSAGEDYRETSLLIEGEYEPPGGPAGRAFDDLLGRRMAHATLAALLSGVGDELTAAYERVESAKRAG
jgi:hypothetical protein